MNKILSIVKNKHVFWNMLGITFNSAYSFVVLAIITRINGIEDAGAFSFVFYAVSILQTFGNYGGRIFQVSDVSENNTSSHYFGLKTLTSLIMFVIAMLFCIVNGYDIFKISLFILLILYRMFESISEATYGVLQTHNNLAIVGKSMTMKIVISSSLFIFVDLLTGNIALATSMFPLIFFLYLVLYDLKNARFYEKIALTLNERVIQLMKDSFQVFLFSFLNILVLNITRYFVDMKMDDTVQGYFSIIVMPAALIAVFAQFVVQPMVKGLVDDYHGNARDAFRKKSFMIISVIFIFGIGISVLSYFVLPWALQIVYGINFEVYRMQLSFVILAGICSGVTTVISTILIIMRKLNIQILLYVISIVLLLLISFIFVENNIDQAIYTYIFGLVFEFILFFVYFYIITKKNNVS